MATLTIGQTRGGSVHINTLTCHSSRADRAATPRPCDSAAGCAGRAHIRLAAYEDAASIRPWSSAISRHLGRRLEHIPRARLPARNARCLTRWSPCGIAKFVSGAGRHRQAARPVNVSCSGSSMCWLTASMSSGLSVPTRLTRLETGRTARGCRTMPSRTS
jgi:hypothetical protein